MKAGRYYVGDPCYVIPYHEWEDFLGQLYKWEEGPEDLSEHFMWNGHNCVALNTEYGDGCYFDEEGRRYPVDAGMIGAIPVELIDERKSVEHLGHIIDFTEDFTVERECGVIKIGHIHINTD